MTLQDYLKIYIYPPVVILKKYLTPLFICMHKFQQIVVLKLVLNMFILCTYFCMEVFGNKKQNKVMFVLPSLVKSCFLNVFLPSNVYVWIHWSSSLSMKVYGFDFTLFQGGRWERFHSRLSRLHISPEILHI